MHLLDRCDLFVIVLCQLGILMFVQYANMCLHLRFHAGDTPASPGVTPTDGQKGRRPSYFARPQIRAAPQPAALAETAAAAPASVANGSSQVASCSFSCCRSCASQEGAATLAARPPGKAWHPGETSDKTPPFLAHGSHALLRHCLGRSVPTHGRGVLQQLPENSRVDPSAAIAGRLHRGWGSIPPCSLPGISGSCACCSASAHSHSRQQSARGLVLSCGPYIQPCVLLQCQHRPAHMGEARSHACSSGGAPRRGKNIYSHYTLYPEENLTKMVHYTCKLSHS